MTDEKTWSRYLEATRARGPRPWFLRALEYASTPGAALELGCGAGADTLEFLRRGYSVLAVDRLARATEVTRERAVEAGLADRLEVRCSTFEELVLPSSTYALVTAGYSLPFCTSGGFDSLWTQTCAALAPGGLFAGQLFGDRDEWAASEESPGNVFLSREAVELRVADLQVLRLEEVEERQRTALGDEKDWHVFHFILRAK